MEGRGGSKDPPHGSRGPGGGQFGQHDLGPFMKYLVLLFAICRLITTSNNLQDACRKQVLKISLQQVS